MRVWECAQRSRGHVSRARAVRETRFEPARAERSRGGERARRCRRHGAELGSSSAGGSPARAAQGPADGLTRLRSTARVRCAYTPGTRGLGLDLLRDVRVLFKYSRRSGRPMRALRRCTRPDVSTMRSRRRLEIPFERDALAYGYRGGDAERRRELVLTTLARVSSRSIPRSEQPTPDVDPHRGVNLSALPRSSSPDCEHDPDLHADLVMR